MVRVYGRQTTGRVREMIQASWRDRIQPYEDCVISSALRIHSDGLLVLEHEFAFPEKTIREGWIYDIHCLADIFLLMGQMPAGQPDEIIEWAEGSGGELPNDGSLPTHIYPRSGLINVFEDCGLV